MEQDDPEATRKAMGIGEPLDVANMVLFLASDESKHINGAELVIDNGATAGDTSVMNVKGLVHVNISIAVTLIDL